MFIKISFKINEVLLGESMNEWWKNGFLFVGLLIIWTYFLNMREVANYTFIIILKWAKDGVRASW